MKMHALVPVIGFGLFLTACGADSTPAKKDSANNALQNLADESVKPKYRKAVDDAEIKLRSTGTFDPVLANLTIKAYNDYANTYPKDTLAPEYLFRASDLAQGTRNYKQATIFLEKIISVYPNYRQHADACFVCAFVYDSYLEKENGETRAKELYEFVIKEYPTSPYADQSKALLQYIGVSDSAMLEAIIKKGGK
jgi:tetratricopeptide (TPR) repeat protein